MLVFETQLAKVVIAMDKTKEVYVVLLSQSKGFLKEARLRNRSARGSYL